MAQTAPIMAHAPGTSPDRVIAPVLEFLRRHAPFDQMAPAHLEFLAKRLRLGFYSRGSVIAGPADGPADRLYILKEGRVRGATDADASGGDAWELAQGECFPIGALLARRPVHTVHRAADDTFCLELERADFDKLLALSAGFHDFCTRRLASLLDVALRSAQADSATTVSADNTLGTPLAELVRRSPVTCTPDTPVREVVELMHTHRIGSVAIVDAERRPAGIFTLHDVLSRVARAALALDRPIAEVMTPAPHSLPSSAPAYEAALRMASGGFGHLCVTEQGRLVGVVSERDLFALQRVGLVHLNRAIQQAADLTTLARLSQDVHRLINQMLAQGASVEQLMQIVTLLNDTLTLRVLDLVRAAHPEPLPAYTWLAFGSEGRAEQTLKTDQDNGLLFTAATPAEAEDKRRRLLPFARKVNDALHDCGFVRCAGNIMAGNPECCLSLDEWKARFATWIGQGTPEHLLKASIFFDFRALAGDAGLAEDLRSAVLSAVQDQPRFLRLMTQNALLNRPPLGLVRDFVVSDDDPERPHSLDLKMNGATPFVDGARILALSHRIAATNTLERLRDIARTGALPPGEAEAWCHSFTFIQLLRMRAHQQSERAQQAPNNRIDPDTLNELDRRILKEAFRQARKLQSRIGLDYQV